MELQRILRLFWAHLANRKTFNELKFFGLIGIGLIALIFVRPYEETSDRVDSNYLSLSERLGYAILLKAGYGEAKSQNIILKEVNKSSEDQSEEKKIETGVWSFESIYQNHDDFKCMNNLDFGKVVTYREEIIDNGVERITHSLTHSVPD